MRISDWSSDVCSADLLDSDLVERVKLVGTFDAFGDGGGADLLGEVHQRGRQCLACRVEFPAGGEFAVELDTVGSDRKSVVWGTSVSVRVALGGRSIITQNKRLA